MIINTLGTVLLTLSICSGVHIDHLPLYADPIPIPDRSFRSNLTATAVATDAVAPAPVKCPSQQAVGPICAPDCKTFMVCAGLANNEPAYTTPCTDMDANKPYCVGNACTTTPDKTNSACESSFKCTSAGTFPDPSDCTVSHYCSNIGVKAKSYQCPTNYVWQSTTLTCVRKSAAYCNTIDCSKKKNQSVVMPYSPGYYAFCGTFDTIMFKCEDAQNYHFDLSTNKCKYNCKYVTMYPDLTNCTNYISCNWVNNDYQVSVISCPPTYKWDNGAMSCVPMGPTQCEPQITTPAPPAAAGPGPATSSETSKPTDPGTKTNGGAAVSH